MSSLAGRRIVLGVTGGIAAYKAVEVCRRLVDAGAHVAPVLTNGAEHFVGRTTFSALASEPVRDLAVGRRRPDPAHPARPGRRPRGRGAGHGPGPRGVRRRDLDDLLTATLLATRAPVRRVPGDAHRDVGAPGGAGQPGHAAAPRRARRRARGRASGRRRRRRRPPGRTRAIVAAAERALADPPTSPVCASLVHRRRHPRADRRGARHHEPLVGQAGLRARRRGRRPGRRRHARHHGRPGRALRASSASTWRAPPTCRRP